MNLAGIVAPTNLNYVYKVTPQKTGTLLPVGSFVNRNFKANQFEYYLPGQLPYHPQAHHHLRYCGTRSTQAPYETNGQQVAPNIKWPTGSRPVLARPPRELSSSQASASFQRARPMAESQCTNGKWDIAPRFGIAYALNSKTVAPRRLRRKL